MEYLDMYDEERRPTGQVAERFGGFPDGGLHLVVHVCVFDARGRMLIQRRQKTKAAWPGRWDLSAGGCALAGETSRQAAIRETQEELGFDPAIEGVRPALTINFSRGFDDLYLIERDVDVQNLRLQADEVMDVRWAACEEVLQMIDADAFIPYRKSLIELLFDMRGQMGMLPVPWPEKT